jgi:hypothetical protein
MGKLTEYRLQAEKKKNRHTFKKMVNNLIILARGDYDPKKRWFYFAIMQNPMCPQYESSDDLIYDLRQCWDNNLFEEDDLKQEINYYFHKWCSKYPRKYVLRKFYPLMCRCIKDYIILSKNLHLVKTRDFKINILQLEIPDTNFYDKPLESIFVKEDEQQLSLIKKYWLYQNLLLLNVDKNKYTCSKLETNKYLN